MNKTIRDESLIDRIFKRAKCPVCGRMFIPTYEYAYKLTNKKTQRKEKF